MGANVQLAVFDLDDRQFGLLLDQVERVIRAVDVTPLPHAPALVLGAIDVQGKVLPVFSVRHRVGATPRALRLEDEFVIARISKRNVVLAVDHVREIVSFPAEAILRAEAILPQLNGIQGVVQLDGGLILIQDLDRFLSIQEDQMLEEALRGQLQHGS